MIISDRALIYFSEGFSCAESVLTAVTAANGLESELVPKAATAFGGGIARTSHLCGALSGALLAIGMLEGRSLAEDKGAKERVYRLAQELISRFRARFGTTNCTELLGCDIGTPEGMEKYEREGLHGKICEPVTEAAAAITADLLGAG